MNNICNSLVWRWGLLSLWKESKLFFWTKFPFFLKKGGNGEDFYLRLSPNWRWYCWLSLGLFVTLSPAIVATLPGVLASYFLGLSLLGWLACVLRICCIYYSYRHVRKTPFWGKTPPRKAINLTSPGLVLFSMNFAGLLYVALRAETIQIDFQGYFILMLILTVAIFIIFVLLAKFAPGMRIAMLEGIFAKVDDQNDQNPYKRIINFICNSQVGYTGDWRYRDDFMQIFMRWALLESLFKASDDILGARSQFFTILLAPITAPFLLLFIFPIVLPISCWFTLSIPWPARQLAPILTASMISWAGWAIACYFYIGRKFLDMLYRQPYKNSLISFPAVPWLKHETFDQRVRWYFYGRGWIAVNFVIIAAIPAYATLVTVLL